MPARIPRKRPLEQSESPRPKKRVATLASFSTNAHPGGNVEPDKSIVLSEVDIAVSEFLDVYSLKIEQFENLKPKSKKGVLRDMFRLIVLSSEILDPNLRKMVIDAEYSHKWDAFVQAHPDLVGVLLECWALNPPSFNRVLELGTIIVKLEVSRPSY